MNLLNISGNFIGNETGPFFEKFFPNNKSLNAGNKNCRYKWFISNVHKSQY